MSTEKTAETTARVRLRPWIYGVAWLPIIAMYTAVFYAGGMAAVLSARGALINVLPDVLLGFLLLSLPRRLNWPEQSRPRFYTIHLVLLLAFIVASNMLWAGLIALDNLLFEGLLRRFEPRYVPFRIIIDIFTYCTVAGLAYAWQNAANGRAQAERAARAETLRAEAQLEAMRSQLNPHFILNTFHALVGLVRRDPGLAETALQTLGDLLRHTLRIQRDRVDEISLREEWSFVQSYLDLERLRLGDRLRVSFQADSCAMEGRIPSFALQTLVENAVHHAVAPRAEGGHVAIVVANLNGHLTVQVLDEGPGGPARQPAHSHGVGLHLLQERLAALYDGRAALKLDTAGNGVRAVLDIPQDAAEAPPWARPSGSVQS